jgi:hypothetical protein
MSFTLLLISIHTPFLKSIAVPWRYTSIDPLAPARGQATLAVQVKQK